MNTIQKVFHDISDLQTKYKFITSIFVISLASVFWWAFAQWKSISDILSLASLFVISLTVTVWMVNLAVQFIESVKIVREFKNGAETYAEHHERSPPQIPWTSVISHILRLGINQSPTTLLSAFLSDDGQTLYVVAFVGKGYGILTFNPADLFVDSSENYLGELSTGEELSLQNGICFGCNSTTPTRKGFAHDPEYDSEVMLCQSCIKSLLVEVPDSLREEAKPYVIANTV